ncbi:hypothetical protein E1B28_007237 [Marasmius oreades]|uniref:DUF6593 domain-containing protein n=1 Tax=Marasmius oreades TaxID=181124 RepID=A0A9P7S1F0_9AGAR|nr:uncharacterized protein E1B28_007237 [Marasmius oreades]KAG7093567.1 hypothetical protein E1B28_007237 [Marasmius oreades]
MNSPRTPLPYIFEDRTGTLTLSDFDDMYDRLFYRVSRPVPQKPITMIFNMERRASRHRDRNISPFHQNPLAVLEFLPDESLGRISFNHGPKAFSLPMGSYLRKTSILGVSRSRKFVGADGVEYRWNHRSVPGHEWTCTTAAGNYLVAHFNLKPPHERAYDVSGNTLTVYEPFVHVATEILATLTIMRHILQYNL